MKRWEYLHLETTSYTASSSLTAAGVMERMALFDQLGDEGWELVAVSPDVSHFFFKRRKRRARVE